MGTEYHYNSGESKKTIISSFFETISSFGIIGLAIIGVGLYFGVIATIFIGQTLFTSVVTLTVPALIKSLFTFSAAELSVIGCLKVAFEGLFVGLFIGCVRRLFIKRNILNKFGNKYKAFGKSFISELFTFDVFNFEVNLVSVILLNMLIGFGVGWVQGAAGTPGLLQTIQTTYHLKAIQPAELLQTIQSLDKFIGNDTIIATIIQNGGAGGAGTGNAFSFILFILIIFIVQGIIIGAATGLTFGVLFGAISGAIKTGSTELLLSALPYGAANTFKGKERIKKIGRSTITGVIEGAIVGGIVGFIQGIITLIIASSSKKH